MKFLKKKKKKSPFDELQRLHSKDDNLIIFDVGAHFGETAIQFKNGFPKAKIFSFEPFIESYEQMKKMLGTSENITALNFGLSNFCGTSLLNSNKSSATNSLLETDEEHEQLWGDNLLTTIGKVEAQFKTFDSVINDLGLEKVHILKIDVQGAEHYVIEGAKNSLEQGIVDVIYTEIITQPSYKGQKRFDEILKMYYDLNYQVHNLYNFYYTPNNELKQIDVIFTRKSG